MLSLNDVVSDDGQMWTIAAHYTHKVVSAAEFSEGELSDIGLAVVARLRALSMERKS
jgi:hypothetical protein